MGWTSKMQRNKNPNLYNYSGKLRPQRFMETYMLNKRTEVSDDTKIRQKVITEIEERCKNGETLDEVANEISERPEIKKHFSYYEKNGIKISLSTIFKNWYNSKQKNAVIYRKFRGLE